MSARSVVRWASLLLAVAGWGGSLWAWEVLGASAGADGGFVLCVAVAITFSIASVVCVVMPDQARIFALGYGAGMECAERRAGATQPPARHLAPVR